MVKCAACNTENLKNAKFCIECGSKLEEDNRPEWVKKYYKEKEEEKKAESNGLFKIEATNTAGEKQEIKMLEDGIKTSDGHFIKYRYIKSIEGKTNVSRKGTLAFGVFGLVGGLTLQTVEIIFKGGKIVIRDVNRNKANKFILAVRNKVNEANSSEFSSMDELKKLAELRNCGVLNEEEFKKKKKVLLNLKD